MGHVLCVVCPIPGKNSHFFEQYCKAAKFLNYITYYINNMKREEFVKSLFVIPAALSAINHPHPVIMLKHINWPPATRHFSASWGHF